MATGVALGLDFSKALQDAEKLDKKISDMVANASRLEQTMKNAFNNDSLPSIIDRLKSSLKDIGETKVNLKFDTDEIKKYFGFLNQIVDSIKIISDSGKIEMFDTKQTYNASNDFLALNENLSKVKARIDEIKNAYNDLKKTTADGGKYINRKEVAELTGIQFPKTKKTKVTGVDVGDNTKAARMWEAATKKQLELLMRRAIEEEAIANKSLQWAKMTEDQKIQYVQKRLNESLKAEQKHTNEVQKEYSKLSSDIIRIYDQISRTEKSIAKGEKAGADVSKEKNNLATLENLFKEKYARLQKIETESGNYVVKQIEEFWVKISERDRKGLEDRIKQIQEQKKADEAEWQKYIRTPEGAIAMSDSAKSINDEREAIKLLIAARDNLSKSTANYEKTVDDLNQRIEQHRISVEQLTTAEKNEKTLQPTVRNEYSRLLVELDKLADAKKRLQSTDAFKGNDAEAKKMYDDIVAREQDVQNRIAQIRANAQGLLDETERKHASERANVSIAELERVEKRRQELAQLYTGMTPDTAKYYVKHGYGDNMIANEKAEISRLVEQKYLLDKTDKDYINTIARLDSQIAEHTRNIQNLTNAQREQNIESQRDRETYSGALKFADQAKSLNDVKLAMEALNKAREKEDVSTKEGVKRFNELTEKLKTLEKNYNTLLGTVSRSSRGLLDITGQLTRRLAGLFGVQSLMRYSKALMNITGEFELQRRSLQSIIDSQREANKIWAQTTQLALKSPYQVKELVTYTKQLAAYRVESEKIHDTTKRLADVSAGLGVDMSRLILAYGQVKAANYLRGTELRQFSEAGVNMLDELAKYFSEIENRAVSVADVFERVSKRGVSFADVDEIFNRLTSASGTFYKMQEKQSETLKGMVSNLRDSIDIMLYNVGKNQMGVLKWAVGAVKGLIDNWEKWATVLQTVATGFLTIKMYSLLASSSVVRAAAAINGMNVAGRNSVTLLQILTISVEKLKRGFINLFKTIKVNPYILAFTALAATLAKVLMTIVSHDNAIDSINKGYQEFKKRITELHSTFVQAKFQKDAKKTEETLQSIAELANREFGMNITVKLDADEDELTRQFNDIKDKLNEATAFSNLFQQEFEKTKWWKASDDIDEDFSQLNAAYTNLSSTLISRKDGIISAIEEMKDAGKELPRSVENLYKALLNPPQDVSDVEIFEYFKDAIKQFRQESGHERHLAALFDTKEERKSLNKIFKDLRLTEKDWGGLLGDYNEAIKEAEREFNMFASRIEGELTGLTKEEKKIRLTAAINDTASKKEWSDYVEWCVKKWSEQKFEVKFDTQEKAVKTLLKWQKTYNEKFGDNIITPDVNESYAGFKKITDAAQKQKEVIERLQAEWASYNDIITRIENGDVNEATGEGGAYEGYDYEKLITERKEIEAQLDWFRAEYTKKKKKDTTEPYKKLAKIIHETHKEYRNLLDLYDKAKSKQEAVKKNTKEFGEVLKSLPSLIGKIDLNKLPIDSEQGAIASLNKLLELIPKNAKKAREEIQKMIGDIQGEEAIESKKASDKLFMNNIDKMFSDYEIGLELKEIDIPSDWAKQFFNVDTIDLSSLKKDLQDKLAGLGAEGQDTRREFLNNKINDATELENKANKKRLETYLQYARDAVGERAKIKLEEVKKLREIEETFGDDPNKKAVKDKAIEGVKKETQEELDKFDWEEFKKSDTFIQLFSDLDNASSALIEHSLNKLREFKKEWKNMKLEDVKEIVTKITQLEDALVGVKPLKEQRTIKRDIKNAERNAIFTSEDALKAQEKKDYETAFQIEAHHWDLQSKQWEKEVSQLETVLRLKEEGKSIDQVRNQLSNEEIQLYGKNETQLRASLSVAEGMVKNTKENAQANQKNANLYAKQRNIYAEQAEQVKAIQEQASLLYGSFKDLYDVLGGDEMGGMFADMGMQMMETVMNTIALQYQLHAATVAAEGFGAAMNTAMGVIGWIVMAINIIVQGLTAIFNAKDNQITEEIENMQEEVKRLEHEFQNLERAIDRAFSHEGLSSSVDDAQANIDARISSYEKMIALEQSRKKADQAQINEWKRTVEELKQEKDELEEEMITELGGSFDVKSVADQFAQAWMDAFKETGNGLKGLQEEFDDFLMNLIVQQMSLKVAGKYIDKVLDATNKALSDTKIDEWEAQQIQKAKDEAVEGMNKEMEELSKIPWMQDWINGSASNLSGLAEGIQGVTESTAQVIEAYLNSIRFFVAENNSYLKVIAEANGMSEEYPANPMLSELRSQTSILRSIESLFDSVILRGSFKHGGGYSLKVTME